MATKRHKGGGRRRVKGHATPGSMVTRKVSKGPNKGDTVKFTANGPNTKDPGKLKPRRVVKDVGSKNRSTIPKGKGARRKK